MTVTSRHMKLQSRMVGALIAGFHVIMQSLEAVQWEFLGKSWLGAGRSEI